MFLYTKSTLCGIFLSVCLSSLDGYFHFESSDTASIYSLRLLSLHKSLPTIRLRGGTQDGGNMTKSKCEPKTNAQSKGGGLGEKLALLKHLDARKPSTLVDEEICGLPTMLGKTVLVLTTDGRNMYGILDCFDRNTNLVLLNVSERVFPHFDIKETTEELDVPVKWPIRPHVDGIDWELASGEPEEEDVCCIRGRNASVESVDFIRLWKPTSTMPSSSRVLSYVLCAAIQRFPKFSCHKYFHVPKIRLGKGDEHEENAAVLNGRSLSICVPVRLIER
jgi:small nuclear ribonucleoprotein (snRNP)-like protein